MQAVPLDTSDRPDQSRTNHMLHVLRHLESESLPQTQVGRPGGILGVAVHVELATELLEPVGGVLGRHFDEGSVEGDVAMSTNERKYVSNLDQSDSSRLGAFSLSCRVPYWSKCRHLEMAGIGANCRYQDVPYMVCQSYPLYC